MSLWLLATSIISLICITSANTTPIQSLPNQLLSKLMVNPPHHLISPPRRLQQSEFEMQFINLVSNVDDTLILSVELAYFYGMQAPDAFEVLLDIFVFRELLSVDLNFQAIDVDALADDISTQLTDIESVDLCAGTLRSLDEIIARVIFPRRRLLQDAYFQAVVDAVFAELSATEVFNISQVLSVDLRNNVIIGEGLLELVRADCVEANADASVAAGIAVADFRALLSGLAGDQSSDSSESSESDESDGSSDSGDDARIVNETEDDLNLDKMSGGNEDGSEVVILKVATSTMTNIWIGLIVFCGVNISLFWICLVRKRKKSVYYETADERPSISVTH